MLQNRRCDEYGYSEVRVGTAVVEIEERVRRSVAFEGYDECLGGGEAQGRISRHEASVARFDARLTPLQRGYLRRLDEARRGVEVGFAGECNGNIRYGHRGTRR